MGSSKLEGQEFKELQSALLSAFPKYNDLKKMVKFELDENLGHITASNNGLDDVVFELIGWTEAKGKVEELVRGARKQNPGNTELKAFANDFLKSIPDVTQRVDLPLQLPRPVQYFTGREKELNELLDGLQPGKVVTLCGPGGIGKSALVAEAIWTLADNNSPPKLFPDGIIYHDFYRYPQVILALQEIVRAFGQELIEGPPPLAAKRVLAGRQVLLVLDGAEQVDDLEAVLEVQNGCGVLIGTRNHKQAQGKQIDIHPLPSDEAVRLLSAWAKGQAADEQAVRKICELVGHLPLAVRLVGRYLSETDEYAEEYLEWLQNTPLEALDQGKRREESVPLLLEKSLTQVSQSAQKALAVVGMLAFAPFDQKVVAEVLGMKSREARLLLGELIKYSLLVRRKSDRHYEVSHALIHTYARERLSVTDENEERFIKFFFEQAEKAANSEKGFEAIDKSHPHILKALEKLKERYAKDGNVAHQQMVDFVEGLDKYWQVHNQYQAQLKWLEEAYHCTSFLEKPVIQASLACRLGRVLTTLSQLMEALSWLEKGKSQLVGLEGTKVQTIQALINIHRARILYLQGDLKQAKADCLHGLEIVKETEQPEAVAEGYNLLGSLHSRSGDFDLALKCLEKSSTIWQQIGNKFQFYRTRNNISILHYYKYKLIDSININNCNLEYWRKINNQGRLAVTLNNSGFLRYILGESKTMAGLFKEAETDYQEAIKHHHQAAEISQRLNLPKELIIARVNRAWTHIALKEWDEAASHLGKSLEIQKKHNITVSSAETYRAQAELAIGREQYNQAIKVGQDAFAEANKQGNRAEKGAANRVLGKAYRLSGELGKAEEYLKVSRTQLRAIKNPFETALTCRELALLYQAQGREEEAQEAEAEVQAILVQMGIIGAEGESL